MSAHDTPLHSPPGDGRKRRLFGWTFAGVAAAILIGVVFLANSSLSLNLENARHGIEERLAALTGRSVQVDGGATFRLLPRPVVELSNIRMDSAEDTRELRVARVIAQLDLIDALIGRTDISRLTLVRPEFTEADERPAAPSPSDPAPAANEDLTQGNAADGLQVIDLATQTLRAVLQRFEGVRYIEVRDGLFRPQGDAPGISNINLALQWDGGRQPAELSGSLVWNGQPADISLAVASPAAFLVGDESQLSATLRAPPVSLRFDGTGAGGTPFQLEGRLSLEAPSLARLSRWIGSPGLALPDFGSIALETDLRLAGERAFLSRTSVGLDDMRAQGALEIAMLAGRPMLAGTLAFESFDFDTLGSAIAPLPRNVLDLQRRIPLHFVRDFDLDLRLSATQSQLAGVGMSDLAATVKFASGNAVVDIGDVSVFGGRAQGRVSLDANAAAPRLTGTYALQGIEAATLAQRLSADDLQLTGAATISGKLDLPVRNWAEIANNNRIEAKVDIRAGTVAGMPQVGDLQEGQRTYTLQPGGQATTFDTLTARLSTAGSFLRVGSFEMAGSAGRMTLQGLIALADTSVSLEGLFEPAAADVADANSNATFTSSKPIEFILRGEWPSLDVTVTPRSKPI
ncbi:Uncharacterized protein involved in outer membrane biogenesis [Aureimonas altamirensis DSM 21988]|uniref:Uncharacterized protein involved in outer membrane biogenesis n=1 Tax=Aureimonas altamirensis DSM 21988 TaxID=1121026 RepID=A0ABY1IGZ9_9HYPH|nr:Uncharacterized protein involved in outer membrane biogenesis [Aureimonas altamirensis DSM 21988]